MTQEQKTEAVIFDAHLASDLNVVFGKIESHARDLARKLDALRYIAKPGEINVATARDVDFAAWKIKSDIDEAIAAIIEGTP